VTSSFGDLGDGLWQTESYCHCQDSTEALSTAGGDKVQLCSARAKHEREGLAVTLTALEGLELQPPTPFQPLESCEGLLVPLIDLMGLKRGSSWVDECLDGTFGRGPRFSNLSLQPHGLQEGG
jgi:hypothetical protein